MGIHKRELVLQKQERQEVPGKSREYKQAPPRLPIWMAAGWRRIRVKWRGDTAEATHSYLA